MDLHRRHMFAAVYFHQYVSVFIHQATSFLCESKFTNRPSAKVSTAGAARHGFGTSGVRGIMRSKLRRRIDPIPREFFEQLHDVGLAPEGTLEDRREIEFVNTGIAIALEVIGGCGYGGRDREFERFGLPAIRHQQLPKAVYRLRGFVGSEVEAAPSGAVRGCALQRGFG